jgi:hypothetical protein
MKKYNRIVVNIKNANVEERKSSKPGSEYKWGQQAGQATEFDEKGEVVQLRPVVIPISREEDDIGGAIYPDKWPVGEYTAPYGTEINGYGSLQLPFTTPLQPIMEAQQEKTSK